MAGRILNDNDFEGLKLYEEDTQTHSIASKQIKKIFTRLFQGTEVNPDDFYFTTFESKEPNAFFIPEKNTVNGKKVIAVSPSLIKECKNEAELAGIIAHECGHYLWGELLGGENSIFQERASDLRAVDLLINGGYNPLNHREVCKRILAYGQSYSDATLNVHGNGLARVEDIDARLTMIANERGNFTPLTDEKDEEYLKFQEELLSAYEKEEYDTYFEKLFKQKYGTKDIKELGAEKILTIFLEEIKKNPQMPMVRYIDVFNKISQIDDKEFENKTEDLTKLCQDFISEMIKIDTNDPILAEFFSKHNPRALRKMKLDLFGDFLIQQKNIENFVNYKNPEDALHWAKEIEKYHWTVNYFTSFVSDDKNYCDVLHPKKEESIGKKLPWDELYEYASEIQNKGRSEDCATLRSVTNYFNPDITHYDKRYPQKRCYNIYGDGQGNVTSEKGFIKEDYFCDENKIVTAYGEEARRLNADKERVKAFKEHTANCKATYKDFADTLSFLNNMVIFEKAQTEEEKQQCIENILEICYPLEGYGVHQILESPLMYLYMTNTMYLFKHPYAEKIEEKYEKSEFRKLMIAVDGQDELPKRALKKDLYERKKQITDDVFNADIIIRRINQETSLANMPELRLKVATTMLNLAEYLEKQYHNTNDETKKLKLIGIINRLYHEVDVFTFSHTRSNGKLSQEQEEQNKRIGAIIEQQFKRSISKSKIQIMEYLLKQGYSDIYLNYKMNSDFVHNEDSMFMQNILKTMELPTTKDVSELIDAVYKKMHLPVPINHYKDEHSSVNTVESLNTPNTNNSYEYSPNLQEKEMRDFWKHAGITIIADRLRYNENFDLVKVMQSIENCDRNKRAEIRDIFAEAINKQDLFKKLNVKEKMYVYEVMEENDLFSEKYANKQEYMQALVKDIKECKDENLKERYAEGMLRGKYLELSGKKHKSKDIEFAKQKDELIELYTDILAQKLGKDDGSDEYLAKATELTDKLLKKDSRVTSYYRTNGEFPRSTIQSMFRKISDKVVSQELTAQMFNERGAAKISGKDANEYDYAFRSAEAIISILANSPKMAKATIDFLSSKLTEESMDSFFTTLKETTSYKRGKTVGGISLDKASLQLVHENFWHADLPIRAYMMNKVLSAYSSKDDDLLNLVVDMHFEAKSPYRKDAERVVKAVYNNLEDYERKLILSALVCANQKGDNNTSGSEAIGEGLKMFFENKGPAFVKFGQLLSYLPTLDKDMRKPLAKLRDKADIPDRAQLFQYLKETLPDEELAKISRVDKILGAGSFFITAKITYEGQDRVVAVMRPYAKDLARSGMDMINNTIEDLSKQDSKYKALKNIAEQARLSAMSETDIGKDYDKYIEAVKMYDKLKIITPKGEFEPEVAKWCSYGSGKDGQVYKIMDMSGGHSLTSTKLTEQEKHDMAIAYTTVELANLLSGKKWDTDRHQGQQNFEQKDFNRFMIGIFDTGAQMLKSPKTKDKIILGELLYGMIRSARLGRSVADYMVDKVKSIDKAGDILKFDTLYIDEVQRGLTALSDIITYQKEIKDEKGKVIQEEKSLTPEEISNIATAIINSGTMDKDIKNTLAAKVILNKLRPWRKGWASSLTEGIKKMTSSITIVAKEETNAIPSIQRKDKSQEEIEAIKQETGKKRKLGVGLKHIVQKTQDNSNPTMAALNKRKRTR